MAKYNFLGIPRSGSQAILQWILSQIDNVKFYPRLPEEPIETEYSGNTLIRYEDIQLSKYRDENNGDVIMIGMLRNPWNMMASQVQWGLYNVPLYKRKKRAIQIWNEYYDEYITQESDIIFIIYDKWFTDIEYRKGISMKLGLTFSDEKFENVPRAGSGSSFDGIMYDGKAQQMNVLNRYKEVNKWSMEEFKKSDVGQDLKNKWNHICDLEEIKELKII